MAQAVRSGIGVRVSVFMAASMARRRTRAETTRVLQQPLDRPRDLAPVIHISAAEPATREQVHLVPAQLDPMRPAGQPLLPVPPLAVAELLAAAGLALGLSGRAVEHQASSSSSCSSSLS